MLVVGAAVAVVVVGNYMIYKMQYFLDICFTSVLFLDKIYFVIGMESKEIQRNNMFGKANKKILLTLVMIALSTGRSGATNLLGTPFPKSLYLSPLIAAMGFTWNCCQRTKQNEQGVVVERAFNNKQAIFYGSSTGLLVYYIMVGGMSACVRNIYVLKGVSSFHPRFFASLWAGSTVGCGAYYLEKYFFPQNFPAVNDPEYKRTTLLTQAFLHLGGCAVLGYAAPFVYALGKKKFGY